MLPEGFPFPQLNEGQPKEKTTPYEISLEQLKERPICSGLGVLKPQ